MIATLFIGGPFFLTSSMAQESDMKPPAAVAPQVVAQDLYLEVFINDASTQLIGAFKQSQDGSLKTTPQELHDVGIKPDAKAIEPDGMILLDHLDHVRYRVDIPTQRLYITTIDTARTPKVFDANPAPDEREDVAQSSWGAVLNYSLFASMDNLLDDRVRPSTGLSGSFDARWFSPYGMVRQSFTASPFDGDEYGVTRLDTTWSRSDPQRMITYRAGDIVSGSLPWTRPVYLGGLQVERNFALRPDLVTLPVPVVSGTAAVPSTLDIYMQNVRTYSTSVPAGPFEVTNLPVITGQGEAKVVLHDTLGRETSTSMPFYMSNLMLKEGLIDFSAEMGFPRRNFGMESDDYAGDLMGVATFRYGLTDWLTLESHFEGGADLLNGGIGGTFPLGTYGVASLAAAGSSHGASSGMIVNGSVELPFDNKYRLYARRQQAFGDYDDIASVSAEEQLRTIFAQSGTVFSARVPRSTTQLMLSTPGPFDHSNLSFAYTQLDSDEGSKIASISYSQSLFESSSFYATAFIDVDHSDRLGLYAGLTIPFDQGITASTGLEQTGRRASGFVDIAKSEDQEVGSYGWRLRTREGDAPDRLASGSYRAPFARVEGGIEQAGDAVRATGQIDGAIAIAAGGVFATNRIDDAFAVVDAGAPDVDVKFENRPAGRTNGSGKLIVPDLRSWERNTIAIDPTNLPVDASVGATRKVVIPADGSGVVVDFKVGKTTASALVSLVDAMGQPLEAGLSGHLEGSAGRFVVGYSGEAFISSLGRQNNVVVDLFDGKSCRAVFDYRPQPGTQVKIKHVVCS